MEEDMPNINIRAIIEIVGAPKDHIEELMKKVIEKIKQEREVVKTEIFEPKQMEDKMKNFWSTFAELEIKFKDINEIPGFCYDYMPSSIEILEPDKLVFKSKEIEDILNDLLSRLHNYEMIIKNLQAKHVLIKKEKKN